MDSFKITLKVRNGGCSHIGEPMFVTGNFNNWTPASTPIGHVPKIGESTEFVLENIEDNLLEFKLTRGDWNTLTCDGDGRLDEITTIDLSEHETVNISVNGWRDCFPKSTASKQVQVLNEAFYFPNLAVNRRVWIYLPEDYTSSQLDYPVIYVHDGQHVFDEATSRGRIGPVEWQVDETIDAAQYKAIVVAIAHADDHRVRDNEYRVNSSLDFPHVQGRAYLKDIVDVLKPYVDAHYRTLSDSRHTAILGSSLGGLLNIYAGFAYADVFGTVGVFSPSIWLDQENVYEALRQFGLKPHHPLQHYYFYCGENENRKMSNGIKVPMATDMKAFVDKFYAIEAAVVHSSIDPQGKHGAVYWQKEFPVFYTWWQEKLKESDSYFNKLIK